MSSKQSAFINKWMNEYYSICCPQLCNTVWKTSIYWIPAVLWRQLDRYVDKSVYDCTSAALVRNAITHGCSRCLPWLNHMYMTPDCYKITPHTSTHIRLIGYNSVCCLFMWVTSDYRGSSILCIIASFPTFFFVCVFHVLFLKCIMLQTLLCHIN